MATVSKKQPAKNKKEGTNKIKIQMNGTSAKVIHDEESDHNSSDDSSTQENPKVNSAKGKESAKDDQTKKKKEAPTRIDTSFLDNVTCTACGRQLNPYKNSSIQKHAELKVIICKKCDKFMSSGTIVKDGDGVDEQCRWCGEGGRLVVCDHCSCAFCKACVMRNFNRSEFNNINHQAKWKCYLCDKSQLQSLRENYRNVRDTMKALQAKEREREQANAAKESTSGNGRVPSQTAKSVSPSGASQIPKKTSVAVKSGSVTTDSSSNDIALSVQDLEVDFMNVDVIMDKLSTATNTFKEMLRALRSQFHSTSPRRADEAPPMFQFSLNSLDTNSKKQRCAKALNRGLITYFQSLRKILHPENQTVAPSVSTTTSITVTNHTPNVSTNNKAVTETTLSKEKQNTSRDKQTSVTSKSSSSSSNQSTSLPKEKSSSELRNKEKVAVTASKSKDVIETPSKGEEPTLSPKTRSQSKPVTEKDKNTSESSIEEPESQDVENETASPGEKSLVSEDKEDEAGDDVAACDDDDDDDDENTAAKLDMIQQLAEEMLDSDEENSDKDEEEVETQMEDDTVQHDEKAEEDGDLNDSEKNTSSSRKVSKKDANEIEEKAKNKRRASGENSKAAPSKKLRNDDEVKEDSSPSKDGKKVVTKSSSGNRQDKKSGDKSPQGSSTKKKKDASDDGEDSSSSDPLDSDDDDMSISERKKALKRRKKSKVEGKSDETKESEKKTKESEKKTKESEKKTKETEKKTKEAEKKTKESEKKTKEAEKKTEEAEKKTEESEKKTKESVEENKEPVKAKRGRPPKNKDLTTNGSSSNLAKTKAKTADKAGTNGTGEEEDVDEDDEMDKEIEKLSKLPSVQKRRQQKKKGEEEKNKADSDEENEDDTVNQNEDGADKKNEADADEKNEDDADEKNEADADEKNEDDADEKNEDDAEAKKEAKKPKRGGKSSKENVDLDDLSSDGEDANKDDGEDYDEAEDEFEPTVTFNLGPVEDEETSAEKDNLNAKNGLLQEDIENEEDEDDDEVDDSSSDEEDPDSNAPSKKSKEKKDKPQKDGEDGDEDENKGDDDDDDQGDSESDGNIGKKKRVHSKLLDSKLSDSDSDVGASKKKKVKDNDSSKEESSSGSSLESDSEDEKDEDSDEDENASDEDEESKGKKKGKKGKKKRKRKKKKGGEDGEEEEEETKGKKGKKRKRIKKMSDSSDNENKEDDDEDDDKDSSHYGKRKKIRKVMSNKKLEDSTKAAAKAEEKRRKRIAAKQREFNIETMTDEKNPTNAPITTKLILEPGKEEGDDPVIQVNKKLIRKLKPHQVDAIQFMWDCLYESVKRSRKEEGAGCILAHCMGLGKTLSVISFVHTVLSHEKELKQRTCLVVSPLNTVLNWRNEWTMWLDKKDQLEVWELASCKQNPARADTLKEWRESGGIMIIGYEMYRNLTTGARIKNKRQKKIFQETLVDPGPDICVCDEGHVLKNEASSLSKAMNLMKTRRRIVLTGTPLQNNLNEYHCMLSFVKPNLLGTRKEFNNRFISPIQNGQCTDSTSRDVRIMKARAHVLHEMLAGCVQRRDYSALTKFLPPKQEYVISVRLADVQIDLYDKYLELSGQGVDGVFNNKGARLFKDYQNLMKIWTHPWVLKLAEIRDELKMKYDDDEDSFIDDDSEAERSFSSSSSDSDDEKVISDSGDDETSPKGTHSKRGTRRTRAKERRQAGEDSDPEEVIAEWKTKMRSDDKDPDIKSDGPERISKEWWAQFVSEDDKAKLELSNKLFLLFEILRMCEEIGDKVLIFSQSILSLNIIESFLETVDSKFQAEMDKKAEENPDGEQEQDESEEFGKSWTKNLDYYRMDGSTSAQNRQMWAENFNDVDNYRARLFLISTKAGGLGINLVAANRVIIFDASWNPSHDVQSIFRVYRFGQIKPCYIYRFLAQGTMEEKIYERQVTKLSLSQRVVDEHQIERHFSANDLRELYNFKPERWEEEGEHSTLALPKDPLLAEILKTHRKCVVSFHEHDSLLENQVEQTLTEEEKKAAWEEYENEKKGIIIRGPGMESMGRTASWPMMAAAQILSKEQIAATVHALRQQLPDLPEDVFHMHVQQALRRQVQMKQEEMRRVEMIRMQELTYLNMMQQQQDMGMGAMQNMAPWMQIQHLRAMQNQLMQGRGYGRMGSMSTAISNQPDEPINLDESPSK